jgi:hypothetical protein
MPPHPIQRESDRSTRPRARPRPRPRIVPQPPRPLAHELSLSHRQPRVPAGGGARSLAVVRPARHPPRPSSSPAVLLPGRPPPRQTSSPAVSCSDIPPPTHPSRPRGLSSSAGCVIPCSPPRRQISSGSKLGRQGEPPSLSLCLCTIFA